MQSGRGGDGSGFGLCVIHGVLLLSKGEMLEMQYLKLAFK